MPVRAIAARIGVSCLLLLCAAAPALASANVSCRIDDRVLEFELEAIAGRTSPINHVQHGSITIKPDLKLAKPKVEVKLDNLMQQWLFGGELRLQIETYDEAAHESITLTITAALDRTKEKYFGRYVLTASRGNDSKVFKGRIKECEAG